MKNCAPRHILVFLLIGCLMQTLVYWKTTKSSLHSLPKSLIKANSSEPFLCGCYFSGIGVKATSEVYDKSLQFRGKRERKHAVSHCVAPCCCLEPSRTRLRVTGLKIHLCWGWWKGLSQKATFGRVLTGLGWSYWCRNGQISVGCSFSKWRWCHHWFWLD